MGRRSWIKLWCFEGIYGTLRKELSVDERSVWFDLLMLAGDSPYPSLICITPNLGYTKEQLCEILEIDLELYERTISKIIISYNNKTPRITILENNTIKINDFDKHQSDWDYRKGYESQKVTKKPTNFTTKNPTNFPTEIPTKNPTNFPTEPAEIITKNTTNLTTNKPTKTPLKDHLNKRLQKNLQLQAEEEAEAEVFSLKENTASCFEETALLACENSKEFSQLIINFCLENKIKLPKKEKDIENIIMLSEKLTPEKLIETAKLKLSNMSPDNYPKYLQYFIPFWKELLNTKPKNNKKKIERYVDKDPIFKNAEEEIYYRYCLNLKEYERNIEMGFEYPLSGNYSENEN